jgi:hypothetical protein
METHCTALTKKGTACPKRAREGTDRCTGHTPEIAKLHGLKGGRPKKTEGPAVPAPMGDVAIDLSSQAAVAATLDAVAKRVAAGSMSAGAGTAISGMCRTALKALDRELLDRLERLEDVMRTQAPHLMPRVRR